MYGIMSFLFCIVALVTVGDFNKFIPLMLLSALFAIADSILSLKYKENNKDENKVEPQK